MHEVAVTLLALLLQGHDGSPTLLLAVQPPKAGVIRRRRSLDELIRLLKQLHRRPQPGHVHLDPLRRRRRFPPNRRGLVGQRGKVPDVRLLPLVLVALDLPFRNDPRCLGLEARKFYRARRCIVVQPLRVFGIGNQPDPTPLLVKPMQLLPDHGNDGDVLPVPIPFLEDLPGRELRPLHVAHFPLAAEVLCRLDLLEPLLHVEILDHEDRRLLARPPDPIRRLGHVTLKRRVVTRRDHRVREFRLEVSPAHPGRDEAIRPIREVRLLRRRVQVHSVLIENPLDGDGLVEGVVARLVVLSVDPVVPSPALHRPRERPGPGNVSLRVPLDPPVNPLEDCRRLRLGVRAQRLDAHPQVRRPLLVEHHLDGLVDLADRQHGPRRLRHPVVAHPQPRTLRRVVPLQLGNLEAEVVLLPLSLLLLCLRANLEPPLSLIQQLSLRGLANLIGFVSHDPRSSVGRHYKVKPAAHVRVVRGGGHVEIDVGLLGNLERRPKHVL